MTTNAFIFAWDMHGIESIIPITQFEDENYSEVQVFDVLSGNKPRKNPFNQLYNLLLLRARFNPHRYYEIYAMDCEPDLDEEFWSNLWENRPREAAELIRKHGVHLFGDPLRIRNI